MYFGYFENGNFGEWMNKQNPFNQAYQKTPWRSQTQLLVPIALILVVVSVIAVFFLNVTASAASKGREIQVMQATIYSLELENAAYQDDLGNLTSLETLRKRADRLGYVEGSPDETEFLVVQGYTGPMTPKLASKERPEIKSLPELPDEYTESVFTWLKKKFDEYSYSFYKVQK
jgi:hypothetical protein